MSSANWCHEKKEQYTIHSSPPRRSQTKGLAQGGGQLWEHGERAIVKEPVTSALNARSQQSGRINEGMTPEQCHPVYCNPQQVEGSAGWDRHSSSNLHKQQMDGQDEGSRRIYNQRGHTKKGDRNSGDTRRPQLCSIRGEKEELILGRDLRTDFHPSFMLLAILPYR